MIQIKFKNLEKSEIAKEAVLDRLEAIIEKFPDLEKSKIDVTLIMENSPTQPGPDLFKVRVQVMNGKYKSTLIEKANPSLYVALAEVTDHLLEKINRLGDKNRVKKINQARDVVKKSKQKREDAFINFLDEEA